MELNTATGVFIFKAVFFTLMGGLDSNNMMNFSYDLYFW